MRLHELGITRDQIRHLTSEQADALIKRSVAYRQTVREISNKSQG
jgi:hypothetical protein